MNCNAGDGNPFRGRLLPSSRLFPIFLYKERSVEQNKVHGLQAKLNLSLPITFLVALSGVALFLRRPARKDKNDHFGLSSGLSEPSEVIDKKAET